MENFLHKKKILTAFVLGVFLCSQNIYATCVELDCSSVVEDAVEYVADFVDENTEKTLEAVEEFVEANESLDETVKEHAKVQQEKIDTKVQTNANLNLLYNELKRGVELKEKLLKLRASKRKFDE